MDHLTRPELDAGLPWLLQSPSDAGHVELIVRRPALNQREVLEEAVLDLTVGLVGDNWLARGNRHTPDHAPDPDAQVTVINSRLAALVAGYRPSGTTAAGDPSIDRRALAGDQLYVDFDISEDNLATGSYLQVGTAVIEISAKPHTGCIKFTQRFGRQAVQFVNSSTGRRLRLRGLNARMVVGGRVRAGDLVSKVSASDVAALMQAVS
ncbi:MAG TPA: MOSC domain-containing protein [Actinomycetota bacterium]|nr:MOSC domain-containing protein [Actinomycetota bacterium]